jgi:hypothetical protein
MEVQKMSVRPIEEKWKLPVNIYSVSIKGNGLTSKDLTIGKKTIGKKL